MSDDKLEVFWKKEGPVYADRTIPANHPYRMNFIQDYILKHHPSRVLEAGCNAAQNLITLHTLNPRVICFGCDIADMKHSMPGFVYFKKASAYSLPFGDSHFPLVFTHGLLMHIPKEMIKEAVSELVRVSNCFVVIREDIEILKDGSYMDMKDAIFVHQYYDLFNDAGCECVEHNVNSFLGVKRLTGVFRKKGV